MLLFFFGFDTGKTLNYVDLKTMEKEQDGYFCTMALNDQA